jgi:hypothetical protein
MARSRLAESSGVDAPMRQVLPLQPGDRLTRPEFERRYEAMPHLKKAELKGWRATSTKSSLRIWVKPTAPFDSNMAELERDFSPQKGSLKDTTTRSGLASLQDPLAFHSMAQPL